MTAPARAGVALALLLAPAWNGDGPSPVRADRDVDVYVWTEAERLHNQMQLTTPPPDPGRPPHYESWLRIAQCESGGNWGISTGNGFYGGLQFSLTSWRGVGMSGYPHQHSMLDQMWAAERLLDMQGWGAWPVCGRRR